MLSWSAISIVRPTYAYFLASVEPLLSPFGFCHLSGQLHRRSGFVSIGLTGVRCLVFGAFCCSSGQLHRRLGVILSVHPTSVRRFNRRLLLTAAGSVHRLDRRISPVHVGSTGVYTVCVFQQLSLAVCFLISSRLFLGLLCVSVAPL